jgi:hypothetical protein
LVVRVFVEVETEDLARHLASQIATTVAGVGRVVKSTVKPYWKIIEYHEVMLVLDGSPRENANAKRSGRGPPRGGSRV